MGDTFPVTKAALRRELIALDRQFSPAERAAASREMCVRLSSQPVWRQAQSILFFSPLPDEPDLRPLLLEALEASKLVALPRFLAGERRYVAARICHQEREVCPGYFGITEPLPECPVLPFNKLDLILVPGVGFTLNGSRLGRGKGYYDRMLAETQGYKCGVAFEWQVTFALPLEKHDIVLDCILTPARWHEVTRPRRF